MVELVDVLCLVVFVDGIWRVVWTKRTEPPTVLERALYIRLHVVGNEEHVRPIEDIIAATNG